MEAPALGANIFVIAVLAMPTPSVARAPVPLAGFVVLGLGWVFWSLSARR